MSCRLLVFAFVAGATASLPADYPTTPMRGVEGNVPMPMVGMGTWQYNDTLAEASVLSAFKLGYRHVDTALGYDNQKGVGRALKATGLPREEYFVTTKIPGGLDAAGTEKALDECLEQLDVDYVDLMLVHYPATWEGAGGAEGRKEEWLAMEKWAKQGKARAIGVSHFCRTHVEDVQSVATIPIALNQVEFHVGMGTAGNDITDDKPWMQEQGIVYAGFSSLCGPCQNPLELITGPLVTRIGKEHGKSGATVALRWATQQGIPVIPKSDNPKHQLSNLDVFNWNLTDSDMAALTASTTPPQSGEYDCEVALSDSLLV